MKKVYVAHPLRGGTCDVGTIYKNYLKADELLRRLATKHENDDILFLSPIHAFAFVSALGPDEWVLGQCRELLSLADEIWVFGDWEHSEGCRMEVENAKKLGITGVFEDGAAGSSRKSWRSTAPIQGQGKRRRATVSHPSMGVSDDLARCADGDMAARFGRPDIYVADMEKVVTVGINCPDWNGNDTH